MQTMTLAALVAALCLAGLHLLAGKLRFLDGTPRSRWLSAAGGVSVAYVVIHLLPELREHQAALEEAVTATLPFLESHVYLVTLLGIVVFYGVERHTRVSRRRSRERGQGDAAGREAFVVSMTSFGIYNVVIGYLLVHREMPGLRALALFTAAMALHFLVNDYGLREDHKAAYHRVGRWLLGAAVLAGWAIGALWRVPPAALAVLVALLAGGVILNVFKEELPAERESRFLPFLLGAAGYALLLLVAS